MADKSTIIEILKYMPDVIGVKSFRASEGMTDLWYETLERYPDGLIKAMVKRACQGWEYTTKIPPLSLINRLCEEKYTTTNETPQWMIDNERTDKREDDALLYRHRDNISDLKQHVFNGGPLNEKQQKAKERADVLMDIWDYKLDAHRIADKPTDPLHRCYKVIYAESIEGDLPMPNPVKGSLMDGFSLARPKAYDEEYYKKEAARLESLRYEDGK